MWICVIFKLHFLNLSFLWHFVFPCRTILGFYSWGRTTNGIVVTIANDSDANDGDGNGRSASPLAQHWLFFHGTAWKHCHLFLRVKTDNGRKKKLIQDWWNVIYLLFLKWLTRGPLFCLKTKPNFTRPFSISPTVFVWGKTNSSDLCENDTFVSVCWQKKVVLAFYAFLAVCVLLPCCCCCCWWFEVLSM